MTGQPHLFWSLAAMLIVVTLPLAQAEGALWYLVVTILAVGAGAWTTARRRRPLLGPIAARLFVLAGCGVVVAEYAWLDELPPVLALSHFMIVVCVSKLLQERAPRDDAQVIVLTLLVLAVGSIVSSHLLFALALTVCLLVGLNAMMRHHLRAEAVREEARNRFLDSRGLGAAMCVSARAEYGRRLMGLTTLIGAGAVACGIVAFVFFPRLGGGFLVRWRLPPPAMPSPASRRNWTSTRSA